MNPPDDAPTRRTTLRLLRQVGQVINVGDDIEIEITRIDADGRTAEVAVTAPRYVTIDRSEIYQRKKRERQGNVTYPRRTQTTVFITGND